MFGSVKPGLRLVIKKQSKAYRTKYFGSAKQHSPKAKHAKVEPLGNKAMPRSDSAII